MKKEIYKLKTDLDGLRNKAGRSTELISLYIHKDKHIYEVTNRLKDEYNQASNIKSRTTRQNVLSTLDSLIQKLKLYRDIPENGIVFFCGAVDTGGNKTDLQTSIVIPPEPITFYKYHCDSKFFIEPLEDMLYDKKIFGLIVLDTDEATIGILDGKNIQTIDNFDSNIMGKHNKGGQSAHRFQQLHEIATNEFYVKIGDRANKIFLPINDSNNLGGIIIGGPSFTKEEFKKGEYLDYRLQDKIIGVIDTGYTDEYGLKELFERSTDILKDLEIIKEKRYMERFMKELGRDTGLALYGRDNILNELNNGRIDTILISENIDRYAIDKIIDIAENKSTEVIFISSEFQEGIQLLKTFDGMAAILRY